MMKYKFDTELKLSNPRFGSELNRKDYDRNVAKDTPFPNVSTLTKLTDQAYYDKEYSLPTDWKFLTKGYNRTESENGYCGVAFWNPKLCQVVVAHRGTSNFGGLMTCVKLVFNASNIEQAQSAATFVYLIANQIKIQNSEGGPPFQLTITGHSLGGWLAQITAVTVEYCKEEKGVFVKDKNYATNIHAHTVTIDNPGCKGELNKLLKSLYLGMEAYDNLDVTVCLGKPNIVNTVNEHLGRIYQLDMDTHKLVEFMRHFDPFACIGKKGENVSKSISTSSGVALRSLGFLHFNFLALKGNPQQSQTYPLNVFNEREKCFVLAWLGEAVKYPSVAQPIRDKFEIPYFQVVDLNMIKGNCVYKTIARIKLIPSIATVTQEMLLECHKERLLNPTPAEACLEPIRKENSSFMQKVYENVQAGWRMLSYYNY